MRVLFDPDYRDMSPEQFLALPDEERRKIVRQVRFIPPQLGRPGFGAFRVYYGSREHGRRA